MPQIKNVVKTNGVVTSWEEFDDQFSVTYQNGKPKTIKSLNGRWVEQSTDFLYSASGEFTGLSRDIDTAFLPYFVSLANGAVTSTPNLTGGIEISAGGKVYQTPSALPVIGSPLVLGLDVANLGFISNGTVANCQRIAPNGQLLRGVKFTSNGGGVSNGAIDIPFPLASNIPSGRVNYLVYSSFPSESNTAPGLTVYLFDATSTNWFSKNITWGRSGWLQFTPALPAESYSQKWGVGAGTPAFGTTSFTKTRLRMDFNAGLTPVFEVYAVLESPKVSNQAPICFTFDDGYSSQYTLAAPILEKYGLRGSFAVIADLIGSGGSYMTWDQLRDLRDRGHEINVHGPIGGSGSLGNYVGTDADRYTAVLNDLNYHRNSVINNVGNINGSANCYVYPQGIDQITQSDDVIRNAIAAAGFKMGRGVDTTRLEVLLPYGGAMSYLSITGHAWASEATEPANITDIQAKLVANVAAKLPTTLMNHYVVSGTPVQSLEIKASNFELICQTAAAQIATGNAVNVTMTGMYKAATGLYPM